MKKIKWNNSFLFEKEKDKSLADYSDFKREKPKKIKRKSVDKF